MHLCRIKFLIRQIICFGLCCSLYNGVTAQQRINFDEGWKFQFGNASNPEKDFNYGLTNLFVKSGTENNTAASVKFKDSSWQSIRLPHDWAVGLPFVKVDNFDVMAHGYKPVGGLFPETSIGWYRKHFSIAATDSGQRFQIQFDGVFRDANLWLNGFYLGNNKSGYSGFSYDITDYINFHGDNVLVVRADATQYEGWFYEGAGIYRHVWLSKTNNLHVAQDGIFAYSTVQKNKAVINVESTIENNGLTAANVRIQALLKDRDGKVVAASTEQPVTFNSNEKNTIKQQFQVTNPRLWSLEDPYLYRVFVEIKSNGAIVDSRQLRFGIRTIAIKPNGVFLNGQHIKLQGTNNHQDHAGLGSALPDYLQYYRVNLLKNMGVNAYRTSHNPPTPELLDACDSLGMLVMDENRLLNSSPEYLNQFERLLCRDRSRACVFMWSIGNEEGSLQSNDYGKRIAQTLINLQQQIDPTRTCTYAADLPNVFTGINEVIPVRGFNYRESHVADYHRDHPDQPIIGTEMGSTVTTRGVMAIDSIRGYLPDQDITAPWWASTAEKWWTLAAGNDYWLGGFIWTGFDYRGEPTPFKWPNINSHFGIMDVCGFPKNLYYYYQSWWTDKDVLHISPHWNHTIEWNKPAPIIDVWVNSNADDVELLLNGKSLGKKIMPRNGHLQWSVPFEKGKLEAIGFKKGRRLTAKNETTGPAAEVVITPYKTTLLADGQDATVINVSLIDKDGLDVPDADNRIQFSISGGDASIIGVGNGDPSSHEPDQCMDGTWQRNAFNGKCQLIIRAGKTPGIIKVQAKAAGLWEGGTDIITVSPASAGSVHIDPQYSLKGAAAKSRESSKVLGADISFLPELEAKGIKFSENGVEKDAIQSLKDHGFNYVRLRIFNDPARDSGYSPVKGFCDLPRTLQMAKRVKAAGMKLLLDFHYSDYWADPGKQYKPATWRNLNFEQLKKALYYYTEQVMLALKAQGTLPDMVQVGNEINHGILWPEGNIGSVDSLAQLLSAGTAAVKAVEPGTVMLLHVALGGQNDETVFFMDHMLRRGVHFDVIGLSYYPKWHGTIDDLRDNMHDLIRRYNKDIIVVEYSQRKDEVNKAVFSLPNNKGKGSFIWEPLSTWESIFDRQGKSNDLLKLYDDFSAEYITGK